LDHDLTPKKLLEGKLIIKLIGEMFLMTTVIKAKYLPNDWPENKTYTQKVDLSDSTHGILNITIIPRGLGEQSVIYNIDFLIDGSKHCSVHAPHPELKDGMKLKSYDKSEDYILKFLN
jgi:hypothetical protein